MAKSYPLCTVFIKISSIEGIFSLKERISVCFKISSINLDENVSPTIQGRDFVIATLAAPTVMKEPEKPAEAAEAEAEGAEGADAAEGEKPAEGDKKETDKKEGEDKKAPAEKK